MGAKKKKTGKTKVAPNIPIENYINDPFFVKKRETASAFLKKVGLPESFIKTKS